MTDSNKVVSEMTETEAFAALRAAKIEKNAADVRVEELKGDRLSLMSKLERLDDDIIAAQERSRGEAQRIQELTQRLHDAPPDAPAPADDADAITKAVADIADKPVEGPAMFKACEECTTPTTCRVNGVCTYGSDQAPDPSSDNTSVGFEAEAVDEGEDAGDLPFGMEPLGEEYFHPDCSSVTCPTPDACLSKGCQERTKG